MDDRLRIIQYLYGEDVDDAKIAYRLSEDGDLYREYEQLRRTKKDLDTRPSHQPDPAVVDEVVDTARAAAQESAASSQLEEDRPARPPSCRWAGRLQTASAALAMVLLVGLGWWQGAVAPEGTPAISNELTDVTQGTAPAAGQQSNTAQAVPAWDDGDELVRIHRRIERLQAQSTPNRWGTFQQVDQRRP